MFQLHEGLIARETPPYSSPKRGGKVTGWIPRLDRSIKPIAVIPRVGGESRKSFVDQEDLSMNRNLIVNSVCMTAVTLCLAMAMAAQAANVEIEWLKPEKYLDIRGGDENQKRFQERVIAALTSYFKEAAAEILPADQTLYLTITNVDLAGDVEYFFTAFPMGVRVMRDIYFPSIEFNYELRDAGGKVLKRGKENIKDLGYMFSGMAYINNPPFDYEKRLIDDWFRKNFR
jgi:hypothetical protein